VVQAVLFTNITSADEDFSLHFDRSSEEHGLFDLLPASSPSDDCETASLEFNTFESTFSPSLSKKRKYNYTSRAKKSNNRKTAHPTSLEAVLKSYCSGCCKQQCLWKWFTVLSIQQHRIEFCSKGQTASLEWLRDIVLSFHTTPSGALSPVVNGNSVCTLALCSIYGFSMTKLHNARNLLPGVKKIHMNLGSEHPTKMKDKIFAFVQELIDVTGDYDPTSNTIYMPVYLSKSGLYRLFVAECGDIDKHLIPSRNTVTSFIASKFANIHFPRKTRLGKCSTCAQFNLNKSEAKTTEEKEQLSAKMSKHRELHQDERNSYHYRRDQSRKQPGKFLHIIMDGSEDVPIPSFCPEVKASAMKHKRLYLCPYGLIDHSTAQRVLTFAPPIYSADPNLTISMLHRHIVLVIAKNPGHHQPTLWLQFDNCYRENKNRWMLAYCCWLVELGIFLEVMISFMVEGHTHEDIDQMFGTMSQYRRGHPCYSIPHFFAGLQNEGFPSSATRPVMQELSLVYDWVAWFAPHLFDMDHHSRYHVFLFRRQPSGRAGMKLREWHSKGLFQGTGDASEQWISLFNNIPPGVPSIKLPQPLDVKYYDDIPSLLAFLPATERQWFDNFLQTKTFSPPSEAQNYLNFPALVLTNPVASFNNSDVDGSSSNAFYINSNSNSINHLQPQQYKIPDTLAIGDLVAFRPSARMKRTLATPYILGKISLCDTGRSGEVQYTVKWYAEHNGLWKQARKSSFGGNKMNHSAVLVGPIILTKTGKIKSAYQKIINETIADN
jgi:hypothetical protein